MSVKNQKPAVDTLANILAGGLALALVLTPRFVPPCTPAVETASPMHCHWTFQADLLLALATLMVAGALWVVRHAEARRVVGGVLALFGVLVIAVTQPRGIGLCGSSHMPCHYTAHWLWLWAALLIGNGVFIASRARIPADKIIPADPWEVGEKPVKGAI